LGGYYEKYIKDDLWRVIKNSYKPLKIASEGIFWGDIMKNMYEAYPYILKKPSCMIHLRAV
jgi:hypothetical protein